MRTIDCKDCGYSIGEDDFTMMLCPICDSFMELNRLDAKTRPEWSKVIRVDGTKKLSDRAD